MRPHPSASLRAGPALYVALWLAALAGFLAMAAFAAAHDTFPADEWFGHRLQDRRAEVLSRILDWTEDLVQVPEVPVLLLAGRGQAVLLAGTLVARPLNSLVKDIVERPRPASGMLEFIRQPSDPSFPSGHAANALLLFGFIFYLATVYVANPWARLAVQALCAWAVIGNGLERVYEGHHWPSDVLGGYYLGAIVLALLIAAHRLALAPRRRVTGPPEADSFLTTA